MTEPEIEDFLLAYLSNVLSLSRERIRACRRISDCGLDSLGLVSLVFEMEKRFNVEFKPEEMTTLFLTDTNTLAATIGAKRRN